MAARLDGVRTRLMDADLDSDGITGGIENIQQFKEKGISSFVDKTELGEALEHLNKDVENSKGLSSVHFLSRLNAFQISPFAAVHCCSDFGVISKKARLTVDLLLRLLVSEGGRGREDMVKVIVGKLEQDIKKAGIKNLSPAGQVVQ